MAASNEKIQVSSYSILYGSHSDGATSTVKEFIIILYEFYSFTLIFGIEGISSEECSSNKRF